MDVIKYALGIFHFCVQKWWLVFIKALLAAFNNDVFNSA